MITEVGLVSFVAVGLGGRLSFIIVSAVCFASVAFADVSGAVSVENSVGSSVGADVGAAVVSVGVLLFSLELPCLVPQAVSERTMQMASNQVKILFIWNHIPSPRLGYSLADG